MTSENQEASEGRIKNFFQNVGIIVTSLVVFFLLAELVTRTVDGLFTKTSFFGQTKKYALYDDHPFLYKVPKPGSSFGPYTVNSKGFRGREFDLPKPEGTYRILTLGGSAVWCSSVSDDDAWPAKTDSLLQAKAQELGKRYQVINGGVPGYNSAESFMNFVWRGLPIQPDAVLVYQGYNDFKPNRWPGEFKSDYSHFRMLDHGLAKSFAESSHFIARFRQLIERLRPSSGERHDDVLEAGVQAFQNNLRRIVVIARAKGIQPLLATYAMSVTEANYEKHYDKLERLERYLPWLSPAGVMQAHKRYNQKVVELGKEMGVPVIDLDSSVPKDFDHFQDHCHLTKKGAAVLAEHLARALPKVLAPTKPDVDEPGSGQPEPVDPPAPADLPQATVQP